MPFKIMYKANYSEPEVAGIGYVLPNKKVRVTYDYVNDDDNYESYHALVDILPNECYIVFDNQLQ